MPGNGGLGVKEAVLRSTWETPPPRRGMTKETGAMEIKDMEKELAESGWVCKPENSNPITTETLLAEIEATARVMDANLKRRVELGVALFFSFIFFSGFYTYFIIQYSSRLSSRAGPDLAEC